MTMLRKTALFATLPLLVGLWLTPLASAHARDWRPRHQPAWSYAAPHHQVWRQGKHNRQYNETINRLDRQEREAQAQAYRKYDGNSQDIRYRERLAKIDRTYDSKRAKVERNLNE